MRVLSQFSGLVIILLLISTQESHALNPLGVFNLRWVDGLCKGETGDGKPIYLSVQAAENRNKYDDGLCKGNFFFESEEQKTRIRLYSEFLVSAPVGTLLQTWSGYRYVRHQNASGLLGWKDVQQNGKVWYDLSIQKVTLQEALEFCHKMNLDLPSGYPRVNNGWPNPYEGRPSFPHYDSDFQNAKERALDDVYALMGSSLDTWVWWSSSPYNNVGDQFVAVGLTTTGPLTNHIIAIDISGTLNDIYNRYNARCVGNE